MENSNIYLSIIITCYNEEKKIRKDIEAVDNFRRKLNKPIELIIVDDRSSDKTVKIIKEMQKNRNWLKLINIEGSSHGKGVGLKIGIRRAQGQYVMFADAGLCVPYENSLLGLKELERGADLAIGSRALKDSVISKKQKWYRRLGSRLFWFLLKLFMGIPRGIRDTQCGFKVYKNKIAKTLYKDAFTAAFMIDIEILLKAKKLGYRIAQFPVEWSSDNDSRFNPFSGTVKNFKELWTIKRRI